MCGQPANWPSPFEEGAVSGDVLLPTGTEKSLCKGNRRPGVTERYGELTLRLPYWLCVVSVVCRVQSSVVDATQKSSTLAHA